MKIFGSKKNPPAQLKEIVEEKYYYCLNEPEPESKKLGSYIYKRQDDNTRLVLSPLFQSYHKLKDFMRENGFVPDSSIQQGINGTWTGDYFRLKFVPKDKRVATYNFLNPLAKKTQKIQLPAPVEEKVDYTDIEVVCGKIT